MPRNINSSKSTNKPSYSHTNNKTATTPIQTPPVSVNHTYQSPSIGTSIKDGIASGFGWGIGTSIARNIFGGNSTQQPVQIIQPTLPTQATQSTQSTEFNEKCLNQKNEYFSCLKNNSAGMCYTQEELLKQCLEK